ncbi:RRXRR domain-containing protein [Streptomyces sp. 2.9]|uniref:RRXRR domain-containing protein n=1 Tax=Streptomyces tritrimontium TaxID=3406573 RepID=UPI003BB52F4E
MFVLNKHGTPLQPNTPARARELLRHGRAVVARHTPFVIRLKDRTAVELAHRGGRLRDKLTARAAYRRGRRTRSLRYRAPRFSNRTRPKGWLAPSLRHRVDTTMSWTTRLARWAPVRAVHVEKAPLRDAAAVNATRWALWRTLDALCVGQLDTITRTPARVLAVSAAGRGSYSRTCPDKYGFPRLRLPRQKQFFGYRTGDLASAVVPTGKKTGTHTGRKHFRLIQRADGYAYTARPEGPAGTP